MRAVLCEPWRDSDALEVKDITPPPPPLRPGRVRIRIAPVGVSLAAQLIASGRYPRE